MAEKNSAKNNTGQLRSYTAFLAWMVLLLVAVNVLVYLQDRNAGLIMSAGLVVYLFVILIYNVRKRQRAMMEMMDFVTSFGSVQNAVFNDFSLPIALIGKEQKIFWVNKKFRRLFPDDTEFINVHLYDFFPDITSETMPPFGNETELHVHLGEKDLLINIRFFSEDGALRAFELPNIRRSDLTKLYTVTIFDETELNEYIRKYEEENMVAAMLYLDNYDEALEEIEEVKRSILVAIIDRKISQYFNGMDCLVRKFELDKYFIVMRKKSLNELRDSHFKILEEIKQISTGTDVSVTISMGIGTDQGSYLKNFEAAKIGIDFSLGRGGDQVVIKSGESLQYFGGKKLAVGKNTKVKARVKAHALHECMSVSDKIVVMGHRITDADVIGSAVGIYRLAKTLNKTCYIVVDKISGPIKPVIDSFSSRDEYDGRMFIDCGTAKKLVDASTLLVVLDTNRSEYVECPEILSMTKNIVVLDHHSMASDVIRNTILTYQEPYASSTCEMVAEILQYFPQEVTLKAAEADALYAGIIIDTDNFMQKTGARTFEAAAYLRRCGADTTRVRKMFREDMNDYLVKGEVIRNVKIFRNAFAISNCPTGLNDSPTIVGAQAANELLDIKGVKASFVLTDYNNKVYISARSLDEVNVQRVMERLGGGGHINIAGCQIEGISIKEAEDRLRLVLTEMIEGDEI